MKINGIEFKEIASVKVLAVEIGPEQAQVAIANMVENQRKPSRSRIMEYAREMIAGKWKVSNDAAIVCGDRWLNANHRLHAIVESGTTQTLLLLKTDDESVMRIADGGLPRSMGSVLKMEADIQGGLQFAAVGNLLFAYERKLLTAAGVNMVGGNVRSVDSSGIVTRQEKIDYHLKRRKLIQSAIQFVSPLYVKYRILSKTSAAALHIIIQQKDGVDAAESFITGLYTGDKISPPQKVIRHALIRNASLKAKLPPITMFGMVLKSYLSHRSGDTPDKIALKSSEEFPKI